jgi:hypothetical protein
MTWDEIMRRVLPPVGGLSPQITHPGAFGAGIEQGRIPTSTIPHKGVDFNFPVGQNSLNKSYPVLHSPVAGVVLNAGEGNMGRIAIRDANGFVHEILHTYTQSVKKGDLVGVGTPIGTMGNTGVDHDHPKDGQYHVHYQLKDRAGRVVNPTEFWNNLDPGKDDPGQPAFLDQSRRAEQIMSGPDNTPVSDIPFGRKGRFDVPFTTVTDLPPGNPRFIPGRTVPLAPPTTQNPIADRSGKWGSVPLPNTPAASDNPAGFNDRYGNWASWPAGALGDVGAPAPQVTPDQGKRSETDDTPVRILSRRADLSPASASVDAPSLSPASAPPLLGIFSGKPMPDYPVWPSIFATDGRPSPDDDELYQR